MRRTLSKLALGTGGLLTALGALSAGAAAGTLLGAYLNRAEQDALAYFNGERT